ncbi:hypothetical protein J6590_030790 [Homalodisca vitripennis]|nr:hypothetical protein J6590_030790 [Homalodisca vitripennis]
MLTPLSGRYLTSVEDETCRAHTCPPEIQRVDIDNYSLSGNVDTFIRLAGRTLAHLKSKGLTSTTIACQVMLTPLSGRYLTSVEDETAGRTLAHLKSKGLTSTTIACQVMLTPLSGRYLTSVEDETCRAHTCPPEIQRVDIDNYSLSGNVDTFIRYLTSVEDDLTLPHLKSKGLTSTFIASRVRDSVLPPLKNLDERSVNYSVGLTSTTIGCQVMLTPLSGILHLLKMRLAGRTFAHLKSKGLTSTTIGCQVMLTPLSGILHLLKMRLAGRTFAHLKSKGLTSTTIGCQVMLTPLSGRHLTSVEDETSRAHTCPPEIQRVDIDNYRLSGNVDTFIR